ncbi:MAG: DUF4129 domain-containing protein [Chloroflexi bacterium]|nr:DUF4129 domain-containing protein [Chloroflexota bacterium]
MRQLFGRKSFALALGAFSILLLVFLAAGLDSLEFRKGTPFTYVEVNDASGSGAIEPPEMDWVFILVIAVVFVMTVFVLVVATPKQRRIILLLLLAMALVFLGIMWWISRGGSGGEVPLPTVTAIHTLVVPQETAVQVGTQSPAAVYTPPKLSPWISIGITFIVLLIAGVLAWLFLRNRWRDNASLEALAGIAEQAVSDLQSGKDYGDAIINCYANMVEAVNRQRGIRRRGNLTPAEFIAVLDRARLPSGPVHSLTALFERVRYGGKKASQKEIVEAVACLREIVSAIREAR